MEQLPATPAMINMLTVTPTDGPAFNTRSQTRQDSTSKHNTTQANTTPEVSQDPTLTPKTLTADRLEALLQMQKPIHSASAYLSIYQMGRHHNTKQISSLMSKDYYINM